ncbi:MAG: glycosyltransferase family 2 protein [Candidatus Bathyarchaeia archaeon]
MLTSSGDVKKTFFLIVIIVWFLCNFSLAAFVINWNRQTSIVLYCLLSFFIFSFSFVFAKRLLSIFLKPYELPKLNTLTTMPRVAVLYTTMNDVVPECLVSIKQSHPCDVYVLDDSSKPEMKEMVDKIAKENGFTVIRRNHREGFKAGALNNWLFNHGVKYDYFVLLDADSFIPEDWVEEALKYAEHPNNAKIAIFQGLINIWNLDNRFVKTLAPLSCLGQDVWEKKLANYLDAVFCYGHNVMMRTKPILEVGGFVTDYASEDFGTAVKLADRGYKSRFVPLHTYEAMPENVRGFIKRQSKWTRGSMEFFDFIKNSKISLSQKIMLSLTPLGHISYVFILLAMFLTIYGYLSTIDDFSRFAYNLWLSPILYVWSIPIFRYTIVLGIISGVLLRIKLHQLKISYVTYLKHQLLSKAIGSVMLPYEVRSMAYYLLDRKRRFPVTPKNEPSLSFQDVLTITRMTLLLIVMFTLGLVFVNPLGILYNIFWLLPFYVSPFVIYIYSKATSSRTAETLFRYVSPNGGKFSISCFDAQQDTVHLFLSIRKLSLESAAPIP